MSTTQTATTVHGSIEYDTRRCVNCDADVFADEIHTVGIDLYYRECKGTIICEEQTLHATETRALCGHCMRSIFGYERSAGWEARTYLTDAVDGMSGDDKFFIVLMALLVLVLVGLPLLVAVLG